MRKALAILTAAVSLGALAPIAEANNIVYIQGRSWQTWDSEVVNSSWFNVASGVNGFPNWNGNAPINGTETNSTVRGWISTYCSGGQTCIIHCYSAGCLRALKAVYDLRASGNSLPGLLYMEGAASAAGGTKIAELSTSGLTKFIAKIIGQQEKVDFDLTPGAARNTWGYVQNSFGANVWHVAGTVDICKSLLFFKVCGNTYVTSGIGGYADGVVGMDSASGASTQGGYTNGCTTAKYSYRNYDSGPYYINGVNVTPCTGSARDHFGMVGLVTGILGADVSGTGVDYARKWGDTTSQSACSGSSCDDKFATVCGDGNNNLHNTTSCSSVATQVGSASNTANHTTTGATCWGHCGGASNGCYCDAACASHGNCCSDYSAANCGNFNAQN